MSKDIKFTPEMKEKITILVRKHPEWPAITLSKHLCKSERYVREYIREFPEIGYGPPRKYDEYIPQIRALATQGEKLYPGTISRKLGLSRNVVVRILKENPDIPYVDKVPAIKPRRKKGKNIMPIQTVVTIARHLHMSYGQCVPYLDALTAKERKALCVKLDVPFSEIKYSYN